tara:strand:- start:2679 stop:3656 length:978 start_codon:yes stop_codon:yes gene_type:complete
MASIIESFDIISKLIENKDSVPDGFTKIFFYDKKIDQIKFIIDLVESGKLSDDIAINFIGINNFNSFRKPQNLTKTVKELFDATKVCNFRAIKNSDAAEDIESPHPIIDDDINSSTPIANNVTKNEVQINKSHNININGTIFTIGEINEDMIMIGYPILGTDDKKSIFNKYKNKYLNIDDFKFDGLKSWIRLTDVEINYKNNTDICKKCNDFLKYSESPTCSKCNDESVLPLNQCIVCSIWVRSNTSWSENVLCKFHKKVTLQCSESGCINDTKPGKRYCYEHFVHYNLNDDRLAYNCTTYNCNGLALMREGMWNPKCFTCRNLQ